MILYKLITILVLAGLFPAVNARAQAKGGSPTCYRIINGPGRGAVLHSSGGIAAFSLYYSATGVIEEHGKCGCLHFHGVLYGANEPDAKCGWGCVVPVPCPPSSVSAAANDLLNAIDFIYYEVDADLGEKLADIFDTMDYYAEQGCYGVVDALAGAFSDELYAYFAQFGYVALFNPYVQTFAAYVNTRLAALTQPPYFPVIAPNTTRILRQIGSGSHARLIDAGPRITLAVGQMLTLQMLAEAGLVNPLFLWQYRWSGLQEGEIPNAAAVAITANYITLVAYQAAALRLTGLVRNPSTGQFYRDVISVKWVGGE